MPSSLADPKSSLESLKVDKNLTNLEGQKEFLFNSRKYAPVQKLYILSFTSTHIHMYYLDSCSALRAASFILAMAIPCLASSTVSMSTTSS